MHPDSPPKPTPIQPRYGCAISRTLGLIMVATALVACGGGGGGEAAATAACTASSTVGCIGTSGGTVNGTSGATVTIPAAALTTVTAIAVLQDATNSPSLPAGTTAAGLVWQLLPHGTTLATPVTLTLPFDPTALAVGVAPRLFKAQPGGVYAEITPITVNGNFITAQVSSFSYFAIVTRVPFNDTGITASQCYAAGGDTLVSCTSPAAIALNASQDGMLGRDVTTPSAADGKLGFGYSTVGSFAVTECVKDNISGLTWEGKPTTGTRIATATYTNYGDNRAGDASAYVAAVNAAGLCGYTNWRLPTADELQTLVDYSVAYPGPTIDGTWFPNTQQYAYWSATGYAGSSSFAWGVGFGSGVVSGNGRLSSYHVRLVR
jgi:hypothetical protein